MRTLRTGRGRSCYPTLRPQFLGNYSIIEAPVRAVVRLLQKHGCQPVLSCGGHRRANWWRDHFPSSKAQHRRISKLTQGRPWVLCAVPPQSRSVRGRQSFIALVLSDCGVGPQIITPIRMTVARAGSIAKRALRAFPGTKWYLLCIWPNQRAAVPLRGFPQA